MTEMTKARRKQNNIFKVLKENKQILTSSKNIVYKNEGKTKTLDNTNLENWTPGDMHQQK